MRFSHSSFFGLTTVIVTSLICGVDSAPAVYETASLRHNVAYLTSDVNQFTKITLTGRDMNNDISQNELNKKSKHNKKGIPNKNKNTKNRRSKNRKLTNKKTKKPSHHASKPSTEKTTKATSSSSDSGSGSYEFSGDGTYYNAGLGSCGITSKDTQMIAALNYPQMKNGANPNNNPICGKKANVKGPKGTVTVTIVDTCPPCKSGDLDLSPAAFGKIGDFVDGRIDIEWSWA